MSAPKQRVLGQIDAIDAFLFMTRTGELRVLETMAERLPEFGESKQFQQAFWRTLSVLLIAHADEAAGFEQALRNSGANAAADQLIVERDARIRKLLGQGGDELASLLDHPFADTMSKAVEQRHRDMQREMQERKRAQEA